MDNSEDYRYQLVMLGASQWQECVKTELERRLKEMSLTSSLISFCSVDQIKPQMPAMGVYFGDKTNALNKAREVELLIGQNRLVLPVVERLEDYRRSVPPLLAPINGMQVATYKDVLCVVNCILEEFQLLKKKRKIFISYQREEASRLAHRLYDELKHRRFEPFLDSFSIDKGTDFQEELSQELADSDMMVLLNSPRCMESRWIRAELAEAGRLQIGIVEVRWRESDYSAHEAWANMTYPLLVNGCEAVCPYHIEQTCRQIIKAVEHWRARSMQARLVNLTSPFLNEERARCCTCLPHLSHVFSVEKDGRKLFYFPSPGVPDSGVYAEARRWMEDNIAEGKEQDVRILYDSLYLKEVCLNHIRWLDRFLPVKLVNSREVPKNRIKIEKNKMKKIFLSASIPMAERDLRYYKTTDVIAIRDAIRALSASVLPSMRLIWGGHPSVTPLICSVLQQLGVNVMEHVTLYQSKYFEGKYPRENEAIGDIQWTERVSGMDDVETRMNSLEEMRRRMLSEHDYVAGIFIGGMEGVEAEWKLFKEYHPNALLLPIGSTGGAARELLAIEERGGSVKVPEEFCCQRLANDFDYDSLFNDLFKAYI